MGGVVSASKGGRTVGAAAVGEAGATGKSRQALKEALKESRMQALKESRMEALKESRMQQELKGYFNKVTYADVC